MEPTARHQDRPGLERFGAQLLSPSMDSGKRCCRLQWYTGATVPRMDYMTGEKYLLTLSMDPKHCSLARLNAGAPVLDDHSSYSVSSVLGVVENATIEGGIGVAEVRFSDREDVTPIWEDIQAGILRNISVGASIRKLKETTQDGDPVKSFLAVDWEPAEISVVPIPADPGAGFLSHQEVIVEMRQQSETTGATTPREIIVDQTTLAQAGQVAAPDVNAIVAERLTAERARIAQINQLGRTARLSEEFVAGHVETGSSVESFRAAAFEELAHRSETNPTRVGTVSITRDQRDSFRAGVEAALMNRWNPTKVKLDSGNDYRAMSLLRLAEEALSLAGVNTRGAAPWEIAAAALGDPVERFAGYMGTTDFPGILANTVNKVLRAAYEANPQTWRAITRITTANDFKPMTRHQLSEAPTPLKVNANGEFKYVDLSEAKESYSLNTYGEIIAINRQMLINDDLAAFTRIPMLQGRAFAQLESDVVWALITSNPTMGADSIALFHASHGNLTGTGTVISVASLGIGRQQMRVQKNLKGVEFLNLVPRWLIVPAALETVANQYTSPMYVATKSSDINQFASGGRTPIEPLVEPRLDAASTTAWYLGADNGQVDIVEAAYLSGQEGVYTETRHGFEVDGMEIKARLDFGAQVLDWRGLYKNVGA